MRKIRKLLFLAVITAVLMLCFVFGVSALAETGQCGENAYWTFNKTTGELVISGTGAMKEYSSPFECNDEIKSVVINEGITSIYSGAFFECGNLTEVYLPNSLKVMAGFGGCDNISYINIPDGVTEIRQGCFSFCTKLERVIIPKSVKTIGASIFKLCTSDVLKEIVYKGTEAEWSEVTVGANNQLLQKSIKYGFCENHINTVAYPEQAPTCTEAGLTEGTFCNDCGYWVSGHLFIKPLRHTDAENDGVCDVCQGTSSDIIIGQKIVATSDSRMRLIPEKSGIYTVDAGSFINQVDIINAETGRYVCSYDSWLGDIKLEAGKLYLVTVCFDEGYYVRGSLLISLIEETTEPDTGDEDIKDDDVNGDSSTTVPDEDTSSDKEETETPDNSDCSCICHKDGFSGFLYKILLFFWKLFKINPVCGCGVAHY